MPDGTTNSRDCPVDWSKNPVDCNAEPPMTGTKPKNPINWSGCTVTTFDLTNRNLNHANLTGTNFSRVDLSGATLHHAIMDKTRLTDATITNTHFDGAKMRGADLTGGHRCIEGLRGAFAVDR